MIPVSIWDSKGIWYKDSNTEESDAQTIEDIVTKKAVVICHRKQWQEQLDHHCKKKPYHYYHQEEYNPNLLDILELYAFVHPTLFTTPSIKGLCKSLGLSEPNTWQEQAQSLTIITKQLLMALMEKDKETQDFLTSLAQILRKDGWGWADLVLSAMGRENDAYNPWAMTIKKEKKEQEEKQTQEEQAIVLPTTKSIQKELERMLRGRTPRQEQEIYAEKLIPAFKERKEGQPPNIVIAQAGTGTGKTLGYMATAISFARKNTAPIWISTYTKALQRQLDKEFSENFTKKEREMYGVIRKGRENYICLLKYEGLQKRADHGLEGSKIGACLVRIWLRESQSGDMDGGDFPTYLLSILPSNQVKEIKDTTDKRGECIHNLCPYYKQCFVEKNIRQGEQAKIVIANHALVLNRAAKNTGDSYQGRYIFDEGHHLAETADSVFANHCTASSGSDIGQWLLGRQEGLPKNSISMNGFHARLSDILMQEEDDHLISLCKNAQELFPRAGWIHYIEQNNQEAKGLWEHWLQEMYNAIGKETTETYYSSEIYSTSQSKGMIETATALCQGIKSLRKGLEQWSIAVEDRMMKEFENLDENTKKRLIASLKQLNSRVLEPLKAHQEMLYHAIEGQENMQDKDNTDNTITFFSIERIEGRIIDVGMHQHPIDPSIPLANLFNTLEGGVITSATLGHGDSTEKLLGLHHIQAKAQENIAIASPFDYKNQAKVLIIQDSSDYGLAESIKHICLSSQGGVLGLFTAIKSLKAVYQRIEKDLKIHDIPLLAQNMHRYLDNGTLIDMFRDDMKACLLGTDTMRDGIDIAGESLKVVVFEKIPWIRRTILNKARIEHFGKDYEVKQVKAKLSQAFGRLIRTQQDKGVFIMLEKAMPTRFYESFPEGVPIIKCSLQDALDILKNQY